MTKAGAPTILVTRPEPGAAVTAQKLRRAGFNAVVQPFTKMVAKPLMLDAADIKNATAIVVTSANALRHLPDETAAAFLELPVFTVGDATRDAAVEKGFENVQSADGNAHDLIKLVRQNASPDSRLIYLCGSIRTSDIESGLRAADIGLAVAETYATVKISQLTDKLNSLFLSYPIDGICFYSSLSSEIFSHYCESVKGDLNLLKINVFCISDRAKDSLPESLKTGATVCEKPRDDAMIETVKAHYFS